MEAKPLFCKCCGALLDPATAVGRVIRCTFCGGAFLMSRDASSKAQSFLDQGEHDLDTCKFDEAYTAYQKAAELDKEEPEAYFGMALATFKVQYLKDVAADPPRLQPICHEISEKKFTEDVNYLRAYRYATDEQRAEYEKKGEEIDYILGEFFRLQQEGRDYDCFLCVKVSDGDRKTEDSKDANYIYDLLRGKGYAPFFSERELRNVTGADYEARILYALMTSECMLVICRDENYLRTPWVKNEYTRFLKLVNDEEKESDSITVVFYEKPVERLPGRRGKLQGIDFSLREADGKIVEFVETHTPAARARREEEARKRKGQEEQIMREIEEQKRAQRELEDRLSHISATGAPAAYSAGPTAVSLVKRAKQEFERNHLTESRKYCEDALRIDPESGAAWLQLFLVETSIKDKNENYVDWNADWDGGTKGVRTTPKDLGGYYVYTSALDTARAGTCGESLAKMKKALAGNTFRNAVRYGAHDAELREFAKETCAKLDRWKPVLEAELAEAKRSLDEAQQQVETDRKHLKKEQEETAAADKQLSAAQAEIANNDWMIKHVRNKTFGIGIPVVLVLCIIIGTAISMATGDFQAWIYAPIVWFGLIGGAVISAIIYGAKARKREEVADGIKAKIEEANKKKAEIGKTYGGFRESLKEDPDYQKCGPTVRRARAMIGVVKERENAFKVCDGIKAQLEKLMD